MMLMMIIVMMIMIIKLMPPNKWTCEESSLYNGHFKSIR